MACGIYGTGHRLRPPGNRQSFVVRGGQHEEKIASACNRAASTHLHSSCSQITAPAGDAECVGDRTITGESYKQQFDDLFSKPLTPRKPIAKPSNEAQQREASACKVPFSNVFGTLMRNPRERPWTSTDWGRASWFAFCHTAGIFAWTHFFSWRMLGIHFLLYVASGMGITYSFHRQLAHRSFASPKWLEYCASCKFSCSVLSYCQN